MGKGQKTEVQKKRKSRDAARQRRGQQNDEFSELASHLPLPMSVSSQLDRLCIMRLTNSYVKVKHVIKEIVSKSPVKDFKSDPDMSLFDASALDALGGFVFVVSMDGQCVYTSPNVIDYLGISQLEMTGSSMYKFVHPCDQEELAKQLDGQVPLEDMEIFDGLFCADSGPVAKLSAKPVLAPNTQALKSTFRSFFLRMKSTITSRGKSVNLNASIFRVVHCLGSIHYYCTAFSKTGAGIESKYLITIGTPLLSSDSFEVPLDRMTFITTHGLDFKLLSCEDKVADLLGFSTNELTGKSWYSLAHACDTDVVKNCHKIVLSKGQGISGYYRMITKVGGWVWMQTKGNVVYSSVSFQPQYIICVNYLISGIEARDQFLCSEQLTSAHSLLSTLREERKRECDETDVLDQPALKLHKPDVPCVPTPPYSDDEMETKPLISVATQSSKMADGDGEIYVPTSGEDDMCRLQEHQEDYEGKLVEEYGTLLDDDDDDLDEDLPILELVGADGNFNDIELSEKTFDELMEDEQFLARAPFIPPPTVDKMLTSLLDSSGMESEDEPTMTFDITDVDPVEFCVRAPYVPEPITDVPLSFDELQGSPLPLVPDFEVDGLSNIKVERKSDERYCQQAKECQTEPRKVVSESFDGGGKVKQFFRIGSAVVPREVVEVSLAESSRLKDTESNKEIIEDSDDWTPKRPLSKPENTFGHVKGVVEKEKGKVKTKLGQEALVFGRLSALPFITNDDAEVNAPSTNLLQGSDLIKALDFVSL